DGMETATHGGHHRPWLPQPVHVRGWLGRGCLINMRDVNAQLAIDRDKLAEVCRRHHIRRLSVFGSAIHDDFTPESDVDLLVEFEPGARQSLFTIIGIEDELAQLVGRKVDLNTARDLSKYFRDEVTTEAEPIYVAA